MHARAPPHGRCTLARKLDQLPETAAAFAAGEITREHAAVIAAPYTPERAEMLDGIEKELVDFARIGTPIELREVVKRYTDAFDGDDGAGEDAKQQQLNKMTVSPTLGGRGIMNGSFDPEVTDIIQTALDAEMEALRNPGETRDTPALRAEAFESICRQYLASRYDTGARGRGQTHVSAVWDIARIEGTHPDLVAAARADSRPRPTALPHHPRTAHLRLLPQPRHHRRAQQHPRRRPRHPQRQHRPLERARRPRQTLPRTRLRPPTRLVRSTPRLALGTRRTHRPRQPQTLMLVPPQTTTHPRRPSPRPRGGTG